MYATLLILSAVAFMSPTCLGFEEDDRKDCSDIMATSMGFVPTTGKYHLLIGDGRRPLWVHCDMTTNGGGWTVIQRRTGSKVPFYRNWESYENGFGDVEDDHWLGNTYLHSITFGKRYVLRIALTDWNDVTHYAEYDDFRVGGAGYNYTLESVGKFGGDCGDSLTPQLNFQFSTFDRDNDAAKEISCAEQHHGAWWYGNCHQSNLNGDYKIGGVHTTFADGINWNTCNGFNYSYKTTIMMVRPFTF